MFSIGNINTINVCMIVYAYVRVKLCVFFIFLSVCVKAAYRRSKNVLTHSKIYFIFCICSFIYHIYILLCGTSMKWHDFYAKKKKYIVGSMLSVKAFFRNFSVSCGCFCALFIRLFAINIGTYARTVYLLLDSKKI